MGLLNEHVYFWQHSPLESYSGNQQKKNAAIRHAAMYGNRYVKAACTGWSRVVLAAPRERLEAQNSATGLLFSICNSGAPDRNSELHDFRSRVFHGTRQSAVEVVFRNVVRLPEGTLVWNRHSNGWMPLEDVQCIDELTTLPGKTTNT